MISLLFYLLTSVCKFWTLLCVLATSVLRVQYQFSIYTFRSFTASPMQLYDKYPGDIVFKMSSYQVLPPFEQSLLKFYTHRHYSKLLCSALSTVWGGFSKTPLFPSSFFSQHAFKCSPIWHGKQQSPTSSLLLSCRKEAGNSIVGIMLAPFNGSIV